MADISPTCHQRLDIGQESVGYGPKHGYEFKVLLGGRCEGGGGLDAVIIVPGQIAAGLSPYLIVFGVFSRGNKYQPSFVGSTEDFRCLCD